jgi:hypothetical protein
MAAITPAAFSIAAAHGITPRTTATWNPSIPRNVRVLVPIQLDALIVREDGGTWANCQMADPAAGVTQTSRRDLLPAPFAEIVGGRKKGIYLHWALPDALTRGDADGSDATFPAIPDRWLVVRMFPSTTQVARRAIRGWVLRAGDNPPTVVALDQWTETGATATSTDALTALGRGDAAWAAYYDNVVNRLGFFDDLSDIQNGPLAYLVCGWYSNPDRDPLGDKDVKSIFDFNSKMASLQWELKDQELNEAITKFKQYVSAATMVGLATAEAAPTGSWQTVSRLGTSSGLNVAAQMAAKPAAAVPKEMAATRINIAVPGAVTIGNPPAALDETGQPIGGAYTTDGSWWPQLTVYHGSVVALGWPNPGWEGMPNGVIPGDVGGPPSPQSVNVAIGSTSAEPLAALVAKANTAPNEARLLEAFMLGSLGDFDQADGPARTDGLLQASEFFSRDGGSDTEQIWIPQMPPTNPNLPSTPPAPGSSGVFPSTPAGGSKVSKSTRAVAGVKQAGFVNTYNFTGVSHTEEEVLLKGGLNQVVSQFSGQPQPPPPVPGHYQTVNRAKPRYFQPSDPVVLVQGGNRAFKHGADGRFNPDGTLSCRLTGFCLTELATNATNPNGAVRPSINGEDILERGIENGSIPPECEDLLREAVILDPGAAVAAAQQSIWMVNGGAINTAATTLPATDPGVQQLARNYAVEQTVWWATRDPRVDHGPLLAQSGFAGTLPSPVAVTLPVKPWTPIHLDWEAQFVPSADALDDWELDETEFSPDLTKLPSTKYEGAIPVQGRAHLTAGIAATVASSVRRALAQAALAGGSTSLTPGKRVQFYSAHAATMVSLYATATAKLATTLAQNSAGGNGGGAGNGGISPVDRSGLEDIASALENMDVLCGAFDGFHQQLRGGFEGDGVSAPASGQPAPSPFVPFRAGFLHLLRLRLVDCFGQVLDLAKSSDTANVDPTQITTAEPMSVDNRQDLQMLPPRFTSPSRLWLRFMDAAGSTNEATADVSPVCGYLLPNHLDAALEFFDANGNNLGVLRPDAAVGVLWEDAPGLPSTVGQTPDRVIPNSFLAGIAQGILAWGTADASLQGAREDALSAMLRIIDSTLWSVDPFGHIGDEHMSLLLGHPVAVLRARAFLEVQEPISPDVINKIVLPLRLGALSHWQDGLLGYFINDDYETFYCADQAVAAFAREIGPNKGFLQQANLVQNYYQQFANDLEAITTNGGNVPNGRAPVNHPYVNTTGLSSIRPNQEVKLTLLVEPHSVVHATTGLVPRKEIGVRRQWVATALAKLSPTFRFGPVLVDPKTIKMPVPTELPGTFSWDHRATVSTWAEDPVVNATDEATLPPDPVTGSEGWLRLMPPPQTSGSNGTAGSGTGGGGTGGGGTASSV